MAEAIPQVQVEVQEEKGFKESSSSKGPIAAVALLATAGWIIFMSGLAAIQAQVDDFFPSSDSSRVLSYNWWVLWLCFFAIVLLFATIAFDKLPEYKISVLGYIVICCVFLAQLTRDIFDLPVRGSRINAYYAGLYIIDVSFYLLVGILGASSHSFVGKKFAL